MAHARLPPYVPGRLLAALTLGGVLVCACEGAPDGPAMSKSAAAHPEIDLSSIPVPPADGPKLAATADVTPVLDRPGPGAVQIGYLHAGALVARAIEPLTRVECKSGWYPIRPRGFVCLDRGATLETTHPTVEAMSLRPKLDEPLPYTYGRVRKKTTLFEPDPGLKGSVRPVDAVSARSGMAIVGSWSARDPEGQVRRLGMMTDGRFISAADLRPVEISGFSGVELDPEKTKLPVGFIVKRGIHQWKLEEQTPVKDRELDYHVTLNLTGRYRTIGDLRFWALANGRWVRHKDVTVVRRRNVFPDFATGDQKWIDISVVTGTCVLYEGRRPLFATLASVGRDRLAGSPGSAVTTRGTFQIVGKHITAAKLDPDTLDEAYRLYDIPWALELSSGQLMHGAYWHDRFGIEHGPGSIQLSPKDANHVFRWAMPELPESWHGATQSDAGVATMVVVRT
jgi:hypothetical protein